MSTFVERYKAYTKGFQTHSIDCDGDCYFSWSPCDTCGSTLGGNRCDGHLVNPGPDGESVEVSSCHDCVMYAGSGELPPEDEDE